MLITRRPNSAVNGSGLIEEEEKEKGVCRDGEGIGTSRYARFYLQLCGNYMTNQMPLVFLAWSVPGTLK
jgi:hypothetical protein